MTNPNNGHKPEDADEGGPRVGQTLQQARLAAHIETNKICADLRISQQALEALEQGNYHLLPGDPYIRALLGSMSRYLGLDPQAIIKDYNREIGHSPQAPSIAPYTDKAQTHSTAHKQIFIVIVLALFVVLFLLIGKLNRGGEEPTVPAIANPAPTESPAFPVDSTPESRSLSPDSAAIDSTAEDSVNVKPVPGAALQGGTPAGQAAAADTAGMHVAVIRPLKDSIGIRVVRSGKEDFATLLRLGKQMQISHPDTITVYTTQRSMVEVTVQGRTYTPNRKRFKIHGSMVKTY
jgi:cytoskeletal protein RodZ